MAGTLRACGLISRGASEISSLTRRGLLHAGERHGLRRSVCAEERARGRSGSSLVRSLWGAASLVSLSDHPSRGSGALERQQRDTRRLQR